MVKDHSDTEKGNPLLPHRLLFPIDSKGSFICTIPQDNSYHGLNGFTPWRIDLMTHHTMSERSYHGATSRSCLWQVLKLCPSPSMTSRFFITITSTKKVMILQLIVVKYYYSWKVGEFLFYLTKSKFKPLKMSIGYVNNKPVEWHPGHLPYLPYPRYATGCHHFMGYTFWLEAKYIFVCPIPQTG